MDVPTKATVLFLNYLHIFQALNKASKVAPAEGARHQMAKNFISWVRHIQFVLSF